MDINTSQNNPQDDGNLIALMDVLSSNPSAPIEKNNQPTNINIPDYSMSKQDTIPLTEEADSAPLNQDESMYNINSIGSYPIQIPKRETEETSTSSISNNDKDFTISTNSTKKQTLNESITDTLLRDIGLIYNKLKYVINPFSSDNNKNIHIRQWDLWGPLIFVTILSCTLALQSNVKGNTITLIYGIFWIGSFLIYLNAYLLNSKTNLFQVICLTGYCLFPFNIVAIILALTNFYNIIRFLLVAAACSWSLLSIFGFLKITSFEEQRYLVYYPAILLYVFISWIIFVNK